MVHFLDDRKSKIATFKREFRNRLTNHTSHPKRVDIPDGLFVKCTGCEQLIFSADLKNNLDVCPKCNFHFKLNANERIAQICDTNSFVALFDNIETVNILDFPDYEDKVNKYKKLTNHNEAFVCGEATLNGVPIAVGVLDSHFMMGSMGSVVGEKVTRLIEYSTDQDLPLIIFSASGGARMQEGIFSLMQMAKTSAAIKYHDLKGLLYMSVLTHPTTGGVAASFSNLGDINIAESGALIGFAGSRVIKQTINQELPEGFQTAEFQLNHGFIDLVVNRNQLKETLSKLLIMNQKDD
jgi:acetyl-CoA carboxylase carboxyl transferase subunit beta